MLIEWISELIDNINHHGVRWGLVFAFYAIFRKERRNYRLDKRDEVHNAYFAAILANQRIIMDKMGVGEEWDGTLTISEKTDRRSLKPSFIGYYEVILKNRFQFPRRKKTMTNFLSGKKKIFTFILVVLLNGLNDTLQLHLTSQTITNVSALGGGYIMIEGILDIIRSYVNRQPPQNPQQPNSKNFIQG